MNDNKVTTDTGEEVELNKWIEDEDTGERVMYVRPQTIKVCEVHSFNKVHECTKCPYMFTGFRSNKHIQKADGIYERESGIKLA